MSTNVTKRIPNSVENMLWDLSFQTKQTKNNYQVEVAIGIGVEIAIPLEISSCCKLSKNL